MRVQRWMTPWARRGWHDKGIVRSKLTREEYLPLCACAEALRRAGVAPPDGIGGLTAKLEAYA